MRLFRPPNPARYKSTKAYAVFEVAFTLADFGAAICFVAGSALFFFESLQFGARTLFLAGSVLFLAKPTIRLARELHYAKKGDVKNLADKLSV